MQRVMVVITGAIALLGAIHNPSSAGLRAYGSLTALSAAAGGFVSGRHVWIQNLPPEQVPACGPSLDYMLDVFPLLEVLEMLLMGDGNCAEVLWSLMGISMPGWVFVAFAGMTAISVFQIVRAHPES
jgi:disulfide bond formation protein DsbB